MQTKILGGVLVAVVLALLMVLPAYAQTPTPVPGTLTTGLISYWPLDETSSTRYDAHGSNDLTDSGGVSYTTGLHGNAARFIQGDSLTHADNDDLSTGDVDYTLAAWINYTTTSGLGILQKLNSSYGEYSLNVGIGSNIEFSHADGVYNTLMNGTLSSQQWYLIIAWYDSTGNEMFLQVNNGTVYNLLSIGPSTDTTGTFKIELADSYTVDGLIDEVGFWKRTLTADERCALYNGGAGMAYPLNEYVPFCNYGPTPTPTPTATDTPSPTPTPTNTPTPSLTPTPGPSPTPSPTPRFLWEPWSGGGTVCPDVSFIDPVATQFAGVERQLDTISSSLAVSSTLFADVTISNDPIGLAKGFMVVMTDITWLRLIWLWFMVAFVTILVLIAVKFITSLEGILERFRKLLELIPGM